MHSIKNLTHDTTTLVIPDGSPYERSLIRNTYYDMDWPAAFSATLTLPNGDPGTRVVLHCVEEAWDGDGDLIVKCDSEGFFKQQTLN